MRMQFERVTRLSVPEEIIESVKEKIINGELLPGDKLPSENKLAEMFGVGRGTIREAMKVMIYLGLIVRNNSRTTFVAENAKEQVLLRNVFDKFEGHRDAFEMIEVRKIIEPEAAALAAERKQDQVIDNLKREYDAMAANIEDIDTFIVHDNSFHTSIFNGTGNRIIIDLMKNIHSAMQKSQSSVIHESSDIKPRSLNFHREIMEAIKTGDSKKARNIMRNHILDVEKEMFIIYKDEKVTLD
jgi:GntR family transcriptional regulator, transcriptional repressor for pyruvate dehydrogenase complex